jgi:hypothetical protein
LVAISGKKIKDNLGFELKKSSRAAFTAMPSKTTDIRVSMDFNPYSQSFLS